MNYVIDIVGTCNLACPSCPNGHFSDQDFIDRARPKGMMDFALFKQIVTKIKSETQDQQSTLVSLYNWGEPFLHPQLNEFVKYLKENNLQVGLSSNFNTYYDIKKIVQLNPDFLRVSISGFYQETYEKGHVRGDIKLVKSNLYALRHYMDICNSNSYVELYYHLYRDNINDDFIKTVALAQELKFGLKLICAHDMSFERIVSGKLPSSEMLEAFENVMHRYIIPPGKMSEILESFTLEDCVLRSNQTVINHDGSVALCCEVYDPKSNISNSFLDINSASLHELKYAHPLCKTCIEKSMHILGTTLIYAELDRQCNLELEKLGFPYKITLGNLNWLVAK